jgi:hypothetical protein
MRIIALFYARTGLLNTKETRFTTMERGMVFSAEQSPEAKILRKSKESCIIPPLSSSRKLRPVKNTEQAGQATVAQLVEQTIRNRQVKGSTPFGGSIYFILFERRQIFSWRLLLFYSLRPFQKITTDERDKIDKTLVFFIPFILFTSCPSEYLWFFARF